MSLGIVVAETIGARSEADDRLFANGYGSALGETTFRIGHMGERDVESIRALTDAIEDVAGLFKGHINIALIGWW